MYLTVKNKYNKSSGFTILELVIFIIAVIILLAVSAYFYR
jgi:Tfp pilus assembly protein PilE